MKNKKGWIKIVEAFFAIMLIMAVLLVVINKGYIGGKDISKKVYSAQLSILREIELDDILREEILNVKNLPIEENDDGFPPSVKTRIDERLPNYLKCEAKICELDKICAIDNSQVKDIYAQSVAIVADSENYYPRQLKLFCWVV